MDREKLAEKINFLADLPDRDETPWANDPTEEDLR